MEPRSSGSHRRSKGEQVRESSAYIDRISSLPSNVVVDHILGLLPLQDAARTSILSRHWRCKWVLLPCLILDENFFNGVLGRLAFRTGTLNDLLAYSKIVNNVLLQHMGRIHKFVLYVPTWFVEISQWVQFVSNNGVTDLTLDMNGYQGFIPENKLPSGLFLSTGLTHLTLFNCCIRSLPPMFSGFPNLISLKLHSPPTWHCIEVNTLQFLISSCPQLESLDLLLIEYDVNLAVDAPKLQKLVVDGYVRNVSLKRTTKIKDLSLNAGWLLKRGIREFLCCLPNAETLVIKNKFWTFWNCEFEDGLPEKFGNEFGHLRSLNLVGMPPNCHCANSIAFYFFRSSPYLQNLYIQVSNCEKCGDMLHQTKEDFSLQCLKKIELVSISDSTHDLQLIKLLLACSPTLEVMTVEPDEKMEVAEERLKIARDLMQFRRASSNAQIFFKG